MSTYVAHFTPEWLQDALLDFQHVAELAGYSLAETTLEIEYLSAPHRPPSRLPHGKMAVYAFFHHGRCLKIGKAGPNSEARYVGQHYSQGSSRSNLARSLAQHRDSSGWTDLDRDHPGLWIRQHTDRLNILLDAELGLPLLALLETFLQCRCKPRFEGSVVSDV